tara:strand:- start:141 stop:293 length:153 start_codon:yes stop_codon:yes gene_type:complete
MATLKHTSQLHMAAAQAVVVVANTYTMKVAAAEVDVFCPVLEAMVDTVML